MKLQVRVGDVTVPISIYELKDGRHMVVWRERGIRFRRPYKSLAKAKLKAEEAAFRIANQTANRELGFRRVRLPEMLEEFLAWQSSLKISAKYLRDLKRDLRQFARAFPVWLDEIDALGVSKYLSALGVGDRRRNNVRDEIVTLFRFAKKHTFLRADLITEAEKVPRVKLDSGAPRIYRPEELQTILDSVRSEWRDWILLGAFAGIRPEESGLPHFDQKSRKWLKLNWREHFLWEDRQIWIPAIISKTGRDRYVTINDTLFAWISDKRKKEDPICARNLPKTRAELFKTPLPFNWIPDGLRHSFASYWQSIHRNAAQLKEEMGNSEAINRRFYYNPQPKNIAKRWFEILPANYDREKIISIGAA